MLTRHCAGLAVGSLALLPVQASTVIAAAPPDLREIVSQRQSEMAPVVDLFEADYAALLRTYTIESSPARRDRLDRFFSEYLQSLNSIDFASMSKGGQVDWTLLRARVHHERRHLEIDAREREQVAPLVPFSASVVTLCEGRQRFEPVEPQRTASALSQLVKDVETARRAFEAQLDDQSKSSARPTPTRCKQAMDWVNSLASSLNEWFTFYDGYDPAFSWWNAEPYKAATAALNAYAKVLKERGAGITPGNENVIIGTPIGREALLAELEHEMIPYSPEELLAIADREFVWCEAELKKAASQMGCGDDWKQALERVKNDHRDPGQQPALIRELALEASRYVADNHLITVPPLADETWRMEMMPLQRQLVNPFFTGGEVISVSFPTAGMSQEQKRMSLRANNIHFARATVFHELIPGHHLQQFSSARYHAYRAPFQTPFWTEGWALYWEMLLWDRGFPVTPENRIGMLFWRTHRCARIIFSLKFHLGEMSPQACVDFLVDRVGHERASAEGEVRRSVAGGYTPLYQCAYMIGGLQFRSLHRELVESGKMTDQQFHDRVLRENNIPVEMVRAILIDQPLSPDFRSSWRFDPITLPK